MGADKSELLDGELTEKVIGAFFAVYNELGSGFLEQVYENALSICLRELGLSVLQQTAVDVYFRGNRVGEYRADLIVDGRLLVEVKVATTISPAHEAQLVNYLKATGLPIGLLLNFGPHPQFKRRIHSGRNPLLSAPIRPNPRSKTNV
ncbi:GxxExxY protein [Arenimonas sp. SCN 70-307]|uniref:GxxExxY protein n=1 Tax=Arenimonas sp. SCN 70-307 TaxID=1660089 RepID=UPI0025BD8B01|nr:GxxExxY protein [Arenimonas sp. SCN 70-307]